MQVVMFVLVVWLEFPFLDRLRDLTGRWGDPDESEKMYRKEGRYANEG